MCKQGVVLVSYARRIEDMSDIGYRIYLVLRICGILVTGFEYMRYGTQNMGYDM